MAQMTHHLLQIVPFTPFAGLLEWVEQTLPLGDYLMGPSRNDGAHARFFPKDWKLTQCNEEITKVKPEERCQAFKRVSLPLLGTRPYSPVYECRLEGHSVVCLLSCGL